MYSFIILPAAVRGSHLKMTEAVWIKTQTSAGEERELRFKLAKDSMVYDVILAAAEASSMRIVDFICFATPKGETDSREVGNRVEMKTLKPGSVIAVVKEMGKQNPNTNKFFNAESQKSQGL